MLCFYNSDADSRFPVFHLILFHDRRTSAPPVFVSRIQCHKKCYFFCGIGILCTAAWADVAQCHLVKGICWNLTMMGCTGKSKVSSMNKHASAWTRTQWMHKALNVPTEHFKTGLKHQRLRTACSCKHIWNLPAGLLFGSLQNPF